MAKPKEATIEVLVPDVHNDWKIYECLDNVLEDAKSKKKVKRVFHLGDLRQDDVEELGKRGAMYMDKIAELMSDLDPELAKKAQEAEERFWKRIKEVGADEFYEALIADSLPPADKQLLADRNEALRAYSNAGDDVYEKESLLDYKLHEDRISRIKSRHSGVEHFGVPGNHDTVFIKGQVPSVTWLPYDQQLVDEKIVGALVCREAGQIDGHFVGEMDERWNGPGLRYAPLGPEGDDDYEDLAKSPLYQTFKGKSIDVIVSHCGGHWGKARRFKGGLGVTKLGEDNPGMVNYAGHDHDGIIYRDPKTRVLTIRPGRNYVAKVHRDGKNVKLVELFWVTPYKAKPSTAA